MDVLGISAFYHDSAAAIVRDGEVLAAAQEERFTRRKHDSTYPRNAIAYCLEAAGTDLESVDSVVYYESPSLKLRRQLRTQLQSAPHGYSQLAAMVKRGLRGDLLYGRQLLRELATDAPSVDWPSLLSYSQHHLSHAAAAFYPSPFHHAAILTVDAVGESSTTSTAVGRGAQIDILNELHFPHSLGLLYSAFTQYLGFKVNSGEYKLMGLAPYGKPRHAERILNDVVDVKADGSFCLNLDYFDYWRSLRMTSDRFHNEFGGPRRRAHAPITQHHMDLAASIQKVTETVMVRLARALQRETQLPNLCLGGGVALNCVANSAIAKTRVFDDIWIQPAAGDAGSALGAALLGYHRAGHRRDPSPLADGMRGALLGPAFQQADVERHLSNLGARFTVLSDEMLLNRTAAALANGEVVGWFQGRMEFGPRALGNRSILADSRHIGMQRTLNQKIKYRESFRPFAPAVLEEKASEWFNLDRPLPYMLMVADIAESRQIPLPPEDLDRSGFDQLDATRSEIPAVTHLDYSARVQTVSSEHNPRFHALITRFSELTRCPVIVNTSFNIRGEPIVHSPEDAFRCFMGTDMDMLVIENCMLVKGRQDTALKRDYRSALALD